jgi:NAD(P)-dependent dehydrogenase (short-subunit alcohol dehydrogenase family)
MPTVIISGANRGLGLEFAKQYAAEGWRVFAGARDLDAAKELKAAAAKSGGNLTAHALDVAGDESVKAFAKLVGKTPVDVLLANAGVFGGDRQHQLGKIDIDEFNETFNINTAGTLRLADTFIANIKAAKGKFIAITSGMGSIDDASGGYYGYRASKAALNMLMHAVANDLKGEGIVSVPLSPGWAKTDMGGKGAPQEVDKTVAEMRKRIASYTLKDSGKFLSWDGRELAW